MKRNLASSDDIGPALLEAIGVPWGNVLSATLHLRPGKLAQFDVQVAVGEPDPEKFQELRIKARRYQLVCAEEES